MTTETAQRRLLEAFAALYRDPAADRGAAVDPLVALAAGFGFARQLAEETGQVSTGAVFDALIDLLAAVRADLAPKENQHG